MSIRIVGAAHQALVAAAFAGSLVACTSAGPRSAADCGSRVVSGSGLLGLMGAMGAFDRPAGPDCRRPVSATHAPPALREEEPPEGGGVAAVQNIGPGQRV
jgi:hypothetical protein